MNIKTIKRNVSNFEELTAEIDELAFKITSLPFA